MKISAVIPVYNGEKFIAECIESILNQTKKFDEIIIIDDESTDNTVNIVKKYPVKLISVKHSERCVTRNIGWKSAKNEIVAIMESDATFSENWVEEVLKGFEKGYDAVIDRRAVYKPDTFIAKMNDNVFTARYLNYKPFNAWAFKKSVLQSLGGFDEQLLHAEDVDIGQRLLIAGFRIYCAKKAFQYHMGEPRSIKQAIKRSYTFGRRMKPYFKRYPHLINIKKIAAFSILPFTLLYWPIFVIFSALLYIYVFLKFFGRLKPEFLFVYPFYVIITEFFFTLGFYAGLVTK